MSETTKLVWAFVKRVLTLLLAAVGFSRTILIIQVPAHAWQIAVVSAVLLILVVVAVSDYLDLMSMRPKLCARYKETMKINSYMLGLLEQSAHVAIFSNDLTWVEESQRIQYLLAQKAQKNEVTIIIPKEVPISKQLKNAGARLITYPQLGVIPRTRFTILFHGTADARVAVGRRKNEYHVIREYSSDELPYQLAEDMVQILSAYNGITAHDLGLDE